MTVSDAPAPASAAPAGESTGRQTGTAVPTEDPVIDLTITEPSPNPPALPEGTLGLQQLLIGSKTLKENTMAKLYTADKDEIIAWRIKRKRYLREISDHNAGHAIKLTARPVKDFVDPVIWNAVSRKKLHNRHKTKRGQPANHEQCAHYFTGTGEYKDHLVTVSANAMDILKRVKYQKGRANASHEDRWFSFMSRRDKALEKVPAAQQDNVRFREAHARYLRSALKPKSLRDQVSKAYSTGIHPGTKVYTPWWMLETKKDVDKTEEMIEQIIEYMDARRKEGFGDHAWDEASEDPPSTSQTKTEVCNNWQLGKCSKGDKCPRKHVGKSGAKAAAPQRVTNAKTSAGERAIGGDNIRCEADINGTKCQYGTQCYFAHRHSVNPRKDAAPRTPPRDHSDKVCNGYGEKGHIVWKCKKIKAHEDELKKAIGYTGDPKWLMDKANSMKCIALFKQKQWFAVSTHNPTPAIEMVASQKAGSESGKMPFTIEKNPIDAGWCWLGWGATRIQLRLYIDLGATCSFSTQGVYKEASVKAKNGELGCARIATEVPKILADSWDGRKVPMKNWMQVTVTANNVQSVQTICIGQYVCCGRAGEERVLVAGKDLARLLGFAHPSEQIKQGRMRGIDPEALLGDKAPPRTYVLSKEEKLKQENNRKMLERCLEVHSEGLAYIGDEAFQHVRPMQWTHEPMLLQSYMSTAALYQAGNSATSLGCDGIPNELSVEEFDRLGQWITGDTEGMANKPIKARAMIDIVRITSETKMLRRLQQVEFRIVHSTEKRAIFGANVLSRLEAMEEEQPDPFQSDHDFNEEAEVENYLEASFDEGRIAGLPKKHWNRYRKLILEQYKFVYRLRLGHEDPAILPELKIKTIKGATMKPGYKIGFDKLTHPQLNEMKRELDRMQGMGVVGDAPLDAILHSLLTIAKGDGSLRWVITCTTANDITIDFWWDQPDNATAQQQRMKGAKYFWVADLLKGYWQIRLHKDSQWMFCFATPWGPKKYLRAPMGCKAVGPFFDMCMARLLESANLLRNGVEMIHDDHAGASATIYDDNPEGKSHYHLLRRYLKMCAQHRIRISPKKFVLFTKSMDFGGILHENGGMRPSPARYQALLDQPDPTTLDEVYTGMCSTGWNRSYIPNFAVLEQPVRAFVMARLGAGKKSTQRAKIIKLETCKEWTTSLKEAYKRLKLALIKAIKRAYRN